MDQAGLENALDIVLQTANIHAFARLQLPDAILIGSALLAGCEAVVSNDREWHRRLQVHFPRFRWIYLSA